MVCSKFDFFDHNKDEDSHDDARPWNIAHRGACYHFPEHTLPAYRLAWELGADYIEPDLVVSSDGLLLAMHDIDLTVTSNVEKTYNNDDQQHQRPKWYSPTKRQSSYWSFNFTSAELAELRLRQRLPEQRSTYFDDLFGMPTLREVANHLAEWNQQLLLPDSSNRERPAGLYVEIKDSGWVLQDTGMDIVELLYHEITHSPPSDEDNPWNTILNQGQNNCAGGTNTTHNVPGLIIQSFNADDLERFHSLWQADDAAAASSNLTTRPPEPPYVLLVDERTCMLDDFWFNVGQRYRFLVSGIGCAVSCLDHFAVRERFLSNHLPAHPWTLRPEDVPMDRFQSLQEQMDYLVCNTSGVVRGIFTETPEVRPPKFSDCPLTKSIRYIAPTENNKSTQSGVIAASFLLGAAIAALVLNFQTICRLGSKRHSALPTSEFSSNSLELT
jgi:glycerophosphoryl diester phosphodiesterase